MALVLNPATRNAGTYSTSFSPSIPIGTTVQVIVTLDPDDVLDPTLAISYFVETDTGERLIQGEWQGGPPTSPKPGVVSRPPTEVIVWPFPGPHSIRGSITINKRVRFGVDVTRL